MYILHYLSYLYMDRGIVPTANGIFFTIVHVLYLLFSGITYRPPLAHSQNVGQYRRRLLQQQPPQEEGNVLRNTAAATATATATIAPMGHRGSTTNHPVPSSSCRLGHEIFD